MKQFQLVIIGSGPGGYVAAIRAGILGLETALVEKDPFLGGTCLHRGCIPTKALLHTAEIYDQLAHVADHGIDVEGVALDVPRVHARKRAVVDKLAKGVRFLMKKRNVTMLHGHGSFVDAHTIRVAGPSGEETVRAEHVIIATGSTPADLPHIKADGKAVINSDQILALEEVPAALAVIGSGAVGAEFASIFASFGSKVHLIEILPRLLPIEDDDCSAQLERSFKGRGIACYTGAEVTAVKTAGAGPRLEMKRGGEQSTLEVDRVLLAAGRRPVLDGLGHEGIGLELAGRHVAVDEFMRTNVPGVYAIGDVVPTPALAHVGSKEGTLAVDHIAGKHVRAIDYGKVPNCTYASPEVASVGLTERAAREKGLEVRVGKFPFSAIGKAMILGETAGFIKIVSEARYDEVLGVHIIGPKATELIAEATLGMNLETTVEEVAQTIHAHPTLSEAMLEAAHAVYGESIHA
ncbi:MAG: dihydrolipoyl dehydrogenase [Candidatus Krumholzibacteria bacterium]|nr:dihydrolipoyl dehydrogenase [Candidatus Krumholzibacteria bacterium]